MAHPNVVQLLRKLQRRHHGGAPGGGETKPLAEAIFIQFGSGFFVP